MRFNEYWCWYQQIISQLLETIVSVHHSTCIITYDNEQRSCASSVFSIIELACEDMLDGE